MGEEGAKKEWAERGKGRVEGERRGKGGRRKRGVRRRKEEGEGKGE